MTSFNKKLAIVLAQVIITAVGCGGTGGEKSAASLKASACTGQTKSVDPESLTIKGHESASPGDAVQYQLSEDMTCATGQDVSWRTVAGKGTGSGTYYMSAFKKPGEYVVTATVTDPDSSTPREISTKTIVADGLAIVGPQIGMAELEHHFSLAVPAGIQLASVTWNFGDGFGSVSSLAPVDHTYMTAGDFVVTVSIRDTAGDTAILQHRIQVLPPTDGMECVRELSTSGPTTVEEDVPVTMSVFIPQCIAFRVGSLRWIFGDNTRAGTGQTVTHTYATPGQYTVTLYIFERENTETPMLTLTRQITVTPNDGVPEDPEEPEEPNPLACPTVGATREMLGDIFTEDKACGVMGTRKDSYRNRITQTCQMTGTARQWVETSRIKELLSEGECEGQACELPPEAMTGVDAAAAGIVSMNGKFYLPHGITKTFFSSQTPAGACSTVSTTRTCSNGVLSGSTAHNYLMCNNGCPGVGPHGTTVTGVVVGETSVPKVCAYGETGITDIFNVIADRTCNSGEISTTNQRNGTIKTEGMCPVYNWVGTENYGACSAACGGSQNRIFECRSSTGELAPDARCTAARPVESRVCDGDPNSVRRSESSTAIEQAGSSVTCPANQIGTIIQKREVTTTTVYACINHAVGVESTTRTEGPWVEERYCKDLVPHRCSQDSLTNDEAVGRYQWMVKCRAQVPMIDEFLDAFDRIVKNTNVGRGPGVQNQGMILNGRLVYATFVNKATGKPWIAPKSQFFGCSVPENLEIPTVCLASCATPEQQILAQAEGNGKLEYVKFVDAWDQKFKFVATLASQSTMSSKFVQKTAVDQWVTELMDGKHEILIFSMKSGGQLKLTPNHPIVTNEGTMKLAGDFKAGESLVMLGGARDPILSINKIDYVGKVYNVFVKSNELHKNIVVTNGYLNGTAFFQNDGAQHLNRRLFQGALIRGVLD